MHWRAGALAAALLIGGASAQPLPDTSADAATAGLRWQTSLDAFASADRLRPPAAGGVLFVGSSSIRLWDGLETQFGDVRIVKRGFGGSRMLDCAALLERLVLPYRPRLVIVYAGDNDLAEGRSPQQVAASFGAFVDGVQRTLPDTRIAFVSIKPSPRRAALLRAIREANALVAAYTRTRRNLAYIDVHTPMLDASGRPRAELFAGDALHLNAAGYALWRSIIGAHLR